MLADQYRATGNRKIKNAAEFYECPPEKASTWLPTIAAAEQFEKLIIGRRPQSEDAWATISRGSASVYVHGPTATSQKPCVLTLGVPRDRAANRALALEVENLLITLGCRSLGPIPPRLRQAAPTLRQSARPDPAVDLNEVFGPAVETASRIHLHEEVTTAFAFMVDDYRCKLATRAPNDLLYIGRRRFLRFHLIGPRPQLDIKIGPVIFGRPILLLGRDFEGMMKRARLLILIGIDPDSRESLRSGLARRAEQLKQHLGARRFFG